MIRGTSAERQANLRLLKSVQQETDVKGAELEARRDAMPILAAEEAGEVVTRILAMSPDGLVEFFQDCRLRLAGETPFSYVYGGSRSTLHKHDPETRAAVAGLNLALHDYDHALLDLRISELFGGRLVWDESHASHDDESERSDHVIALDIFAVLIAVGKIDAFYGSLAGQDIGTIDRENLYQLKRDWPALVLLSGEADEKLES